MKKKIKEPTKVCNLYKINIKIFWRIILCVTESYGIFYQIDFF